MTKLPVEYKEDWTDADLIVNLQSTGYTVRMVDAKHVIFDACVNVGAQTAAREFWKRTNNVSAMTGIIERVAIIDRNGDIKLVWEFEKGYTYDGENYLPSPVLKIRKDYAKKAKTKRSPPG